MITCSIDTREFDKALSEYYEVSKSTLADIINRKAFFIAMRAMGKTPIMEKREFSKTMRQMIMARRQPPRKGGMVRRIYAIVQKIHYANYGKGAYGAAMKEAAKEFAQERIRGRGFFKSGWLPAIVRLGKKYSKAATLSSAGFTDKALIARQRYNPKNGYVIEAKPDPHCFAEIGNKVAEILKGSLAGKIGQKGEAALQEAFNHETSSMLKEVEKRLISDSIKLGMKA